MNYKQFTMEIGGRKVTVETGKYAEQTNGSCVVRCGETVVMVSVCMSASPRDGMDFFPLQVDYEEKMYSVGKIPGKQSLKNSFLRPPLPISRNLPFSKPLLASAAFSLLSESFPKSAPIWRLFLRRNTYAHGLGSPQPAMKAQGRKNLSGSPRPDAASSRFWYSVRTLSSKAKSIQRFVTAVSVSKSVVATRKQSLP